MQGKPSRFVLLVLSWTFGVVSPAACAQGLREDVDRESFRELKATLPEQAEAPAGPLKRGKPGQLLPLRRAFPLRISPSATSTEDAFTSGLSLRYVGDPNRQAAILFRHGIPESDDPASEFQQQQRALERADLRAGQGLYALSFGYANTRLSPGGVRSDRYSIGADVQVNRNQDPVQFSVGTGFSQTRGGSRARSLSLTAAWAIPNVSRYTEIDLAVGHKRIYPKSGARKQGIVPEAAFLYQLIEPRRDPKNPVRRLRAGGVLLQIAYTFHNPVSRTDDWAVTGRTVLDNNGSNYLRYGAGKNSTFLFTYGVQIR
uniref:Uncharacterized protein n=1 Tax=uncultured Armatimonadetes bacterium TaxID=157466 RepID=A0A6J4K2W6_9BACT|nr:hypothetical protein AVDCRST_MAG63-4894 [uncultured Armatimonadetes bacterium]